MRVFVITGVTEQGYTCFEGVKSTEKKAKKAIKELTRVREFNTEYYYKEVEVDRKLEGEKGFLKSLKRREKR